MASHVLLISHKCSAHWFRLLTIGYIDSDTARHGNEWFTYGSHAALMILETSTLNRAMSDLYI